MSGGISATTVIAAIGAAATAASSLSSMMAGKPKTPSPVAAPVAPTINDAQQQADQQNATNQRQGALANLLQPTGGQAQSSPNMSLRNVLGG